MRKFLIGYSGHSYPVIESLRLDGIEFDGYFEFEEKEENPYNLNYLGFEKHFHFKKEDEVFIAIGNNLQRSKIFNFLKGQVRFFSVIDKAAIIRSRLTNEAILVNAGAIIQPECQVGDGSIINSGAIIEHECRIGRFTHIAPGVVLGGNVEIGDNSFVGLNSTILPGIKIGRNCIIGAGSVVTKNIDDNKLVKGNPAK